ncbi:MAG: DUF4831 family protein [Alistipes sp.]|nr:DUF4831 family protein [Alistipes sp.]
MKRSLLVALLLVASSLVVDSSAQQVVKKRIGSYVENGNVVVAEANTTLAVDIVVEKEQFVAGPYAKHAQRLLGTNALLVDKVIYRIVESDVSVAENSAYIAPESVDLSKFSEEATVEFPKVLPDRLSKNNLTIDQAADRAAAQIYALRTARLELVTAELGDGVYGAGLESALREIDRLEQEYLELFYGKRIVTYSHQRYYVTVKPAEFEKIEPVVPAESAEPAEAPAEDKSAKKAKKPAEEVAPQPEPKMLPARYTVARFNNQSGLLSEDDLTGEIIMLVINPVEMSYPESDVKGNVFYRYANNADVTLCLGSSEVIVERVLPIYEFGRTVSFVKPAR